MFAFEKTFLLWVRIDSEVQYVSQCESVKTKHAEDAGPVHIATTQTNKLEPHKDKKILSERTDFKQHRFCHYYLSF